MAINYVLDETGERILEDSLGGYILEELQTDFIGEDDTGDSFQIRRAP